NYLCNLSLNFFLYLAKIPSLAQACSLCPIQNSEFIIPFAARTLTHPITPIAPIIARVAHTPLFPLLPQSLPTNSTTAAFSPLLKGG
ncbi:hypothetical protein, partial [Capnocytophaga sp. oral taxon 332]|uniref:hypothetical protein n=1 Tax=Capnocytophaga sp. oral taxon 332 TaxID=712213 RepID=UPI001E40206B